MSKFISLIGDPVKQSISPYFQQAAFNYLQLDICYEARRTSPMELEARIAGLRNKRDLGANITVPHKEAVLPLLDKLDELAAAVGAVNTVVNRKGKLWGFNTDVQGFIRGLRQEGHFDPEGKRVLILGAGGVAGAASLALVQQKAASLVIINRTQAHAQTLVDRLESYMAGVGLITELATLSWQSSISVEAFAGCQLIVNCTSLGMKHSSGDAQSPLPAEVIPTGVLVYDMVYNPAETLLLQMSREKGANTLGGLAMLVYQGAASFELWTGKKAPVDIMFKCAREGLKVK